MGNGIAQVAALAGFNVLLVDVTEAALSKAMKAISERLDRLVDKNKLDAMLRSESLSRIATSTKYESLVAADIVIEAATENIELKTRIIRDIERSSRPGCLIASNTSSISITALAAVLDTPAKFIGMHFFNPVQIMPLVEVISGVETSDDSVSVVIEFAEKLGKSPVKVRNSPGFVVNRILVPMINEAFFVLGEGLATAEEIDAGMRLGANHPIGPLALADLIGLDVCLSVMSVFMSDFGDSKYRVAPLLRELVSAGRLGRKVGHGVFRY